MQKQRNRGGNKYNKRQGFLATASRPESYCRVFLPYDDAYEQDEDEDNDGGHDAVLVHPARQIGRRHFRKT